MFLKPVIRQQYINIENNNSLSNLSDTLYKLVDKAFKCGHKSIVFVCIGTDRSTGDSLGPLIGYKISSVKIKNVYMYGNLENPVHAKNLEEVMNKINCMYENPYIIAIDACLGKMEHVGCISVGEGSIKPGAGVKKDLPAVGNAYITGIVNFGGFMDFLILQNTRLHIVMKMADIISNGIKYALWKMNSEQILEDKKNVYYQN